jgi:hypothetical protein
MRSDDGWLWEEIIKWKSESGPLFGLSRPSTHDYLIFFSSVHFLELTPNLFISGVVDVDG